MFNVNEFLEDLKNDIIDKESEELNINLDENFSIVDENQVMFFMKRIEELNEEKEEVEKLLEEDKKKYIEKIDAFKNKKVSSIDNTISYFSTLLEKWAVQNLDGKKKSFKTPFGTLGFRSSKEKFIINKDLEDKLIEKLKLIDNSLIKVESKESLIKKELDKKLKVVNGEILLETTPLDEFIKHEQSTKNFYIKNK